MDILKFKKKVFWRSGKNLFLNIQKKMGKRLFRRETFLPLWGFISLRKVFFHFFFFFFFYKQNCNINTNVKKNCTRIKLTKHLAITEKERKRKYVYTRHNKTIVIQATIKEMPDCICTDAETQLCEF